MRVLDVGLDPFNAPSIVILPDETLGVPRGFHRDIVAAADVHAHRIHVRDGLGEFARRTRQRYPELERAADFFLSFRKIRLALPISIQIQVGRGQIEDITMKSKFRLIDECLRPGQGFRIADGMKGQILLF